MRATASPGSTPSPSRRTPAGRFLHTMALFLKKRSPPLAKEKGTSLPKILPSGNSIRNSSSVKNSAFKKSPPNFSFMPKANSPASVSNSMAPLSTMALRPKPTVPFSFPSPAPVWSNSPPAVTSSASSQKRIEKTTSSSTLVFTPPPSATSHPMNSPSPPPLLSQTSTALPSPKR